MKYKKYLVYKVLSLILGIVALITFIIMCKYYQNTKITLITSAIISVFGGGFASVLVAWLIEKSAKNKEEKEKEIIRRNIMSPAYKTIKVAFLNFSRLSRILNQDIDEKFKTNAVSWMQILSKEVTLLETIDCKDNVFISLLAVCNNLNNRIDEVRRNRIQLMLYEMITNEEYYILCELQFLFNRLSDVINQNDKERFLYEFEDLCEFVELNIDKVININKYSCRDFSDFIKNDNYNYIVGKEVK